MTRRYGVTITNTGVRRTDDCRARVCTADAYLSPHRGAGSESPGDRLSDPGNAPEFCKAVVPQIEAVRKTVGVVGLGAIGFAFAKMAAWIRHARHFLQPHREAGEAYSFCGAGEFTRGTSCESGCDLLHLPENGNIHVINKETIARMRDGVIFNQHGAGNL